MNQQQPANARWFATRSCTREKSMCGVCTNGAAKSPARHGSQNLATYMHALKSACRSQLALAKSNTEGIASNTEMYVHPGTLSCTATAVMFFGSDGPPHLQNGTSADHRPGSSYTHMWLLTVSNPLSPRSSTASSNACLLWHSTFSRSRRGGGDVGGLMSSGRSTKIETRSNRVVETEVCKSQQP